MTKSMELNYHQVWQQVNSLEERFNQFTVIRDLLKTAKEKCSHSEKNYEAEKIIEASILLFDIYVNQWDEQFRNVWEEVIVPLHQKEYPKPQISTKTQHNDLDALDDVIERAEEFYNKIKVGRMSYQEAIENGWEMTDDGFWMPPQDNLND